MDEQKSDKQRNWNRLTLLLIGGIPVVVMLTATWLWVFVARGDLDLVSFLGTANRGNLVNPLLAIDDLALKNSQGKNIQRDDMPTRWIMLIPGGATCDSNCNETLYLTRQVRLALGSESRRVRRWYLNLSSSIDQETQTLIEDSHPDLETVVASRVAFADLLSQAGLEGRLREPGTWWIVDPSGWIMMFYTSDNSYKDSIGDLKFLLKNTSEEGTR